MCNKYEKKDLLRVGFFETLFSMLIYKGTKEEQNETFGALKNDGNNYIHNLFEGMCREDGIEYPYLESDIKVEVGGIHFIQIRLPEFYQSFNDIKRAYIA